MDIGAIIYDRLANDAAVAAIVGTRITAIEASDKEALPLIVYNPTVDGANDGTAPLVDCSVEVHCWAADDGTAQQLADAVIASLHDYSARLGDTWLYWLQFRTKREDRSFEFNEWGRLLTFQGMAAYT